MCGRNLFQTDFVHDGGKKTCLVPQLGEKFVEQRHGCGFAVGAGDTYQFQLTAWIVVEGRCDKTQCDIGVFDFDIAYIRVQCLGQRFADDGAAAFFNDLWNILVAISLCAALGNIQWRAVVFC